jgi:predicted acyltransferase
MNTTGRIISIDIMRGLTLILILFVNDLNMTGLPAWLGHMPSEFDGLGLAGWILPGFLFIVGMAIPFSIEKRISEGQDSYAIARHISIRTVSLLIIGVLMLNIGRVDRDLTGMSANSWAILMYIGVFLTWNDYRDNGKNFFTITGFRLTGMALLTFLVFKFQSGQPENSGSLITGSWGIIGIIGWGYMVAAFIYLAVKDNIINTTVAFLFFLLLNILNKLDLLTYLDPAKPLIGVITEGSVPMIVLAGMLVSILMKKYSSDKRKFISIVLIGGIVCILTGFVLRNWFIISEQQTTPSWGMICTGISIFLFGLLYIVTEVYRKTACAVLLKPAGENSLTTYLAPNILYHLIWISEIPVLFYKNSSEPLLSAGGSLIWAFLMVGLATLLVKMGIRIKL